VSPELQDLLKKLIEKDPNNRIGHQADSDEIKKHSWFRSINWDRIKKRQYNMSTDYFYIDTIQSSIELLNMPEVKL
jgi:serine/threonine protein kinase